MGQHSTKLTSIRNISRSAQNFSTLQKQIITFSMALPLSNLAIQFTSQSSTKMAMGVPLSSTFLYATSAYNTTLLSHTAYFQQFKLRRFWLCHNSPRLWLHSAKPRQWFRSLGLSPELPCSAQTPLPYNHPCASH